ncbi:putative inorganic polyphosphate/ATP-NAD kinase [compost metagenome]|jgi:NAD+ kinase|uniref:NAD kinase n=1 Tax=Cupriavidus campinensis TaxID=151783 RepID=A0AAE9I117_9BURK|nr:MULTISPECIES: NAD kinase [Cupriavidus]TSP14737.1 NAD kinase [Cupriavidus campinensis]URF05184.1 NAD kinase [Cupriavidus campinensis]CAG2152474.1 NAD kinase [Cupriavidus campinensis]
MSAPQNPAIAPAAAPRAAFQTVALVGRYSTAGIEGPLEELAACISRNGQDVVFERETAQATGLSGYPVFSADEIGREADVAVVLGGDGTLLGLARQLAGLDVPLIGVNHGRLGFMTDIPLEDVTRALPEMLAGRYEAETRMLLESRVIRDDGVIFSALAFNDVVVNRSGISGMVELAVSVDGYFMYNQRSDGLIVSTPTGSTAYALAAGGPILHPTLSGLVLVPIAPHALSNRPIVLPHDAEVTIEVATARDASANFDMQSLTSLLQGDRIVVRRSSKTVTLLHPVGYNYYATLRKKLHWHEYPTEDNRL